MIPKFCTATNIAVQSNNSIVLTLLYTEDSQVALIDRVIIDMEHAKKLHEALGNIFEQGDNDEGS